MSNIYYTETIYYTSEMLKVNLLRYSTGQDKLGHFTVQVSYSSRTEMKRDDHTKLEQGEPK